MRAIIKPTAYIAWLPMGNITVKPADAYVSWLPLGTLSVTPEVCASWVPMGEIHIKPVLCASIVPGSQKTNADTSRKVSKPLSAAGDTLRRIGRPCSPMADMARKVCRWETFGGDTIRSIAVSETVSADTGRRTYLPSGAIVAPSAYISWIPIGKIFVKPTTAYISWLPLGTISLRPQIAASIVPPLEWQVTVTVDAIRKVVQSNDVRADTSLKTTRFNTAIADTSRKVCSPFIAVATVDLLRRVIMQNRVTADTQRMVGGEWTVIEADTRRLLGADYCVVRGDIWRSVSNVAGAAADTLRIRGIGNLVSADTMLVVGWGELSNADLLRKVVKQERTTTDTSIRYPWVLEYVNRFVKLKSKRLKAPAATPITQNFHDHGIRSFSMVLGELTLSDTFQLETVQPMNIDDEVQGQIFDYHFHFLVEETSQRDLVLCQDLVQNKMSIFHGFSCPWSDG